MFKDIFAFCGQKTCSTKAKQNRNAQGMIFYIALNNNEQDIQ